MAKESGKHRVVLVIPNTRWRGRRTWIILPHAPLILTALLRDDFDFLSLAAAYEKGGADCLSVLTEDKFFKGQLSFLDDIRSKVGVPLLRKDFIIDELLY